MGHTHIVWVLLSAARIAVRALKCITSHVAELVGVWNGLCAPASKPILPILRPSYLHNEISYTGKMAFYIESGPCWVK